MMTDEAQPSSSSDANVPPPEPDPPPRSVAGMISSSTPLQVSQPHPARSGAHSSTSEENQSSSTPNSSSTPPWLRWSRGLTSLLDDPQGKDLFEKYLDQEGCSAQLNFLWACDGLKSMEDQSIIPRLVSKIHKYFFRENCLLGVTETTRSELTQAFLVFKNTDFKPTESSEVATGDTTETRNTNDVANMFDKARDEVFNHMKENLYPNFLKSEIFLCAVNGEDETTTNLQDQLEYPLNEGLSSGRKSSCGDTSSVGVIADDASEDEHIKSLSAPLSVDVDQKIKQDGQSPKIPSPPLSTAPSVLLPNQLQTVHEDKELTVNPHSTSSPQQPSKLQLGLTKEALQLTQRARASVPVAPLVGIVSKIRGRECYGSHCHQKSGNSSTQVTPHPYHASYSSYNPVSRVDSEIQSMSSDAMTDEGAHGGHGHSDRKHGAHHHGSRSRPHQNPSSSSSHVHLRHDSRRQCVHPGLEIDNRDNLPMCPRGVPFRKVTAETDPKEFAAELALKLDKIKKGRDADEKLSQRTSELCDHDHSRGGNGGAGGGGAITTNVLAAALNKLQVVDDGLPDDILDQHMSRVFSDITPDNRSPKLRSPTAGRRRGVQSIPFTRSRRERDVASTFSGDSGNVHDYPADTLPLTKSRSIPCELKIQQQDFSSGVAGSSHSSHRGRLSRGCVGHRDSRNMPPPLMKMQSNECIDSGISVVSGATPTVISAAPPPLPYERTDLRVAQWMEQCEDPPLKMRSRKSASAAHPSHTSAPMPPTPTLEEVRRRLAKKTSPLPTVLASQSTQVPIGPLSSASSANVPRHHSPPSSDESSSATKEHFVTSFVYYEDPNLPYCLKIPSKPLSRGNGDTSYQVTLATFKDHLPKRGNYRYFFKRKCTEIYAEAVQEEITDDTQELPLFEGKIIARLQTAIGGPCSSASMSVSERL